MINLSRHAARLTRAAALAALLLPVGCIERTNPFDPANLRPPIVDDIRKQLKPVLDSLVAAGQQSATRLPDYLAAFRKDTADNGARVVANQSRHDTNAARKEGNDAVAAANLVQTDADLLGLQVELVTLDTLRTYGPYPRLDGDFDNLLDKALATARVMEKANSDHSPVEIYSPRERDSVLAPLVRDSAAFAELLSVIKEGNTAVREANLDIEAYNKSVREANKAIGDFNVQVDFLKQAKQKGVVVRSDSLVAQAGRTGPGDTLLLGPAEFRVDLRVGTGTKENPILIRGYPGRKSIILPVLVNDGLPNNQGVILDTNQFVIFEDLVFRGGRVSGVKLSKSSRFVTFRRCLFEGNQVWGIDAVGSDLHLFDCEIRGNGNDSAASSGGIRVETAADPGGSIQLENVLIAYNRGYGIEAVSPNGSIARSTLAYNTKDGLRLSPHDRNLHVTQSIVAFNDGYGIWRNPSPTNPDGLVVRSSALKFNALGDWHLRTLDPDREKELIRANFDVDPGFTDPAAFDFRPKPGSPLARLESDTSTPVVVGYRPRP